MYASVKSGCNLLVALGIHMQQARHRPVFTQSNYLSILQKMTFTILSSLAGAGTRQQA